MLNSILEKREININFLLVRKLGEKQMTKSTRLKEIEKAKRLKSDDEKLEFIKKAERKRLFTIFIN